MIRIILDFTFLVLFLLVSYLIFPIMWVIGKIDKEKKDYACLRVVQWGFRVLIKGAGTKVTVIGKENIPEEAALFIGNHRSFFDIIITYTHFKNRIGFIAKDAVEKAPSLRVWMRHLYCLFLNRKDPREGMKIILKAIDQIKEGISIFVFPEGTRNKGEELSLLPFKEGTFKIATKTGCPIVPVAINNTAEIFESHFPKIKKTHVIIEYCTPIYPNELSREELKGIGAKCQSIIQDKINKNAELV